MFLDALDPRRTTGFVKDIQLGQYECNTPVVTPSNVGSILTGKNPGQHGLVAPTRFREGTRQRPAVETILEKLSHRGYVFSHGIPFTANQKTKKGGVGGGNMDGSGEPVLPCLQFPPLPINMGDIDPEMALQHFMDLASMIFASFRDLIRAGAADYYFIGFRNLDSFTHWFQDGDYYDRLLDHVNGELKAFVCMGDDIDLFVFSDHGCMPAHDVFRINLWLKENGWLDYNIAMHNHAYNITKQAKNKEQIGPFSREFELIPTSKFLCADAFDSCVDAVGDVTEEDCKKLCEELMGTGNYEWVKTREELWPGLSDEEYERIPKIIPRRVPGVLVSSNCHPGIPIQGFTDHDEIINSRNGDHWTQGYYGCTVDLELPDELKTNNPESLYHMIDLFCEPPEDEEEDKPDVTLSNADQGLMADALADMGYV